MKLYVLTTVIFIAFYALFDQSTALYCREDVDCNAGDCCLEYFPYVTRCSDSGDDVGDRCGGQFYCGCQNGLYCKPHQSSIWNFLKLGKGTCQKSKGDSRYFDSEVVVVEKQV